MSLYYLREYGTVHIFIYMFSKAWVHCVKTTPALTSQSFFCFFLSFQIHCIAVQSRHNGNVPLSVSRLWLAVGFKNAALQRRSSECRFCSLKRPNNFWLYMDFFKCPGFCDYFCVITLRLTGNNDQQSLFHFFLLQYISYRHISKCGRK